MSDMQPLATRPVCAKCGRPVDRFFEAHDVDFGRVEFIAWCHGEQEKVVLTEAQAVGLSFGTAFVPSTPLLTP